MAKTFLQMKNAVADWLGIRESDTQRLPASVRGDIVNMKIRELCRKADFRFLEKSSSSVVLSAGEYSVSLPADFSRPYLVRLRAGSDTSWVDQLTYSELLARYPDPANESAGTPECYAVWGSTMYFSCRADQTYTVVMEYYQFLGDLSADNDVNDFLTHAWDVVLFGCLADAALYGIEDGRIPAFAARYNELLNNLIAEHARSKRSGGPVIAEPPG